LYAMRPQAYIDGLPSEEYKAIVGQVARCDISEGTPVRRGMVGGERLVQREIASPRRWRDSQ